MAEITNMRLEGDVELLRMFKRLERDVGKKIVKTALRNGAKLFQNDMAMSAVNMVGGKTGTDIAKHLVVRVLKRRPPIWGIATMIDPKSNDIFVVFTKDGKRYYIPNAIEFGHAFPRRGGGKNAPKDVMAIPFARTTFESKKDSISLSVRAEMMAGIIKTGRFR